MNVYLFLLYLLYLKHISHLCVGTTDASAQSVALRKLAAIAENVDKGEGSVKRHGAKRAPLGVEIPAVAHFMSAMAAVRPQFAH